MPWAKGRAKLLWRWHVLLWWIFFPNIWESHVMFTLYSIIYWCCYKFYIIFFLWLHIIFLYVSIQTFFIMVCNYLSVWFFWFVLCLYLPNFISWRTRHTEVFFKGFENRTHQAHIIIKIKMLENNYKLATFTALKIVNISQVR